MTGDQLLDVICACLLGSLLAGFLGRCSWDLLEAIVLHCWRSLRRTYRANERRKWWGWSR